VQSALEHLDESHDMNHGAAKLWANKHMPPAIARAMLPADVWNSYYKFVFVRNPYDWAISQFTYSFKPKGRKQLAANALRSPRSVASLRDELRYRSKWIARTDVNESDIDHLWDYLKSVRGLASTESLLQKSYAYDLDCNKNVDFVGKFENLTEDLEKIGDMLGVHIKALHLNPSKRPNDTKFTLTADGRRRVRELWDEDFSIFGYA